MAQIETAFTDQKDTIQTQSLHETNEGKRSKNFMNLLKLESDIRKIKRCVNVEKDLQKNMQQFERTRLELDEYQLSLKCKKRQMIEQHLHEMEDRKKSRNEENQKTEQALHDIKKKNQERRKKMESVVNQYRRQYDEAYQRSLHQRREMINQVNMQDIFDHEHTYLAQVKKARNIRVKTESHIDSERKSQKEHTSPESRFLKMAKQEYREQKYARSIDKEKAMDKFQKRIQYGNKVQKQLAHVKVEVFIKSQDEVKKGEENIKKIIDSYKESKQNKKARLDTNNNLTLSSEQRSLQEISKIKKEKVPLMERIKKLAYLSNGYTLKYQNGNQDAFDMICNASLARADLLLNAQ